MDAIFDILAAHPLANAIGAFAAVLGAAWPIFKTRTVMLWLHAVIHVAMCAHFFLLGALSGSLMNALGLGQTLAAIPLGTRPGFRKIYIAYLPLIAAGAVYTWDGYVSIFAAGGLALMSLARYQTDVMKFRVLMIAAICSWATYDTLVQSIPALTLDAATLVMSFAMIRRERRLIRERRELDAVDPS